MSDRDPLAQHRASRVAKREASSRSCLTRQRLAMAGVSEAELRGLAARGFLEFLEDGSIRRDHRHAEEVEREMVDVMFTDSVEQEDVMQEDEVLIEEGHKDKGKGRAVEEEEEEEEEVADNGGEEKEEKCFPLMDLPAELRLNIYRACLTRPYNILLSKVEQPVPAVPQKTLGKGASVVVSGIGGQPASNAYGAEGVGRPAAVGRRRFFGANEWRRRRNEGPSAVQPPLRTTRSMVAPPMTPSPFRSQNVSYNDSSDVETGPVAYHARFRASSTDLSTSTTAPTPKRNHASPGDPLIIALLRTSKQVYREARDVLYSENVFTLSLDTAVPTLACLHQRSRRHIKFVEVEIPTYTEIIERFSEVVRLSLRYCSGLRRFTVHTPFTLPGAEGGLGSNHGTVYANGFDILRWLPQQCEVVLSGTRNAEIEAVVGKHLMLAKAQDKESWTYGQCRVDYRRCVVRG